MFPGYVLIHMIMNDDTWYVVRNTRGVTGFVGPGSKPVPLSEEEMMSLGFKAPDVVEILPSEIPSLLRPAHGRIPSVFREPSMSPRTVHYNQRRDVRP